MDAEEQQLKALLDESTRIGESIDRFLLTGERVAALGVALAAATAAALGYGVTGVAALLPFAAIGLLGYGLHLLIELASRGGYRRYLELRINHLTRGTLLQWESEIVPRFRHRGVDYRMMAVVTGVGYVVSVAIGVASTAVHHRDWDLPVWLVGWTPLAYDIVIAIFSGGLLWMFFEALGASNKVFDASCSAAKISKDDGSPTDHHQQSAR